MKYTHIKKQAMKYIRRKKKEQCKYTTIKKHSIKSIQICVQKCTNIKNMQSNALK